MSEQKYALSITGTVALAIDGAPTPITYELMFDHVKIEADGLSSRELLPALTEAFSNAIIGRRKPVDSLEAAYPWAADERLNAQLAALDDAGTFLEADASDPGGRAATALVAAGIRMDLSKDQVAKLGLLLRNTGKLPYWASVQADVEGIPPVGK
jgi:hypothetical protein